MRPGTTLLTVTALICFLPLLGAGQSSMEFQSGTIIEVTTGADICADAVTIDGTYSGSGTKCGGALPVQFVAMQTQVVKRSVMIRWTTATEADNYGFEIERRAIGTDGMLWESVGFVPGGGTQSAPCTYSFTDGDLAPGRYAYRLRQIDRGGRFTYCGDAEVEIVGPKEYALDQNYPNPFNPVTTISYALPSPTHVTLRIYNALGQVVAELIDEEQEAGYGEIRFDAGGLSSGIYVYRLQAGSFTKTMKMVVMK